MPRVGIRKLVEQTTKIVRDVRENRAEYVITHRGRPVAVLLPLEQEWLEAENQRAIQSATPGAGLYAELEALRQEIGESWQSDKTAVELVSEGRR